MSGLLDRAMAYIADEIVKKDKIIWYSLLTGRNLTTADTQQNTYGGRKISDYDVLLFIFGVNDSDIRRTAMINTGFWISGRQIVESVLHGSSASSASSYNVGTITVSYKSDTAFMAKCGGSGTIKRLSILGGKIMRS